MTIKNQKTTYEVEATSGAKRLSGSISVRDNAVIEANLNVNEDGKYANYSRNSNGDESENINGTKGFTAEARTFILAEISAFESEVLN